MLQHLYQATSLTLTKDGEVIVLEHLETNLQVGSLTALRPCRYPILGLTYLVRMGYDYRNI